MKRYGTLLLAALLLAACAATHPPKYHSAQLAPETREDFVEYAEARLHAWEEVADDMAEENRREYQPLLSDLRSEMAMMELANASRWFGFRDRINTALYNLNQKYYMEAE